MARQIEVIEKEMFDRINSNENLSSLNSTSKVANYRLFIFIVSFSIRALEVLFDLHKKEVDDKLANQKSGTLPWYRTMALKFQYGFDLIKDHDYYDNSNVTSQQIENSKIIKYAAVGESDTDSRVIIKIAGETSGKLSPIEPEQKKTFDAYIKEIKWAGVSITVVNYRPDKLYLEIQIKRDVLVLDKNGMSIKNAGYPVIEALSEYMKELPFDGDLRLSAIVDKLQKVPGVLDATIISSKSAWINESVNDYDLPQPFSISKIPVSGYFEVVTFENIEYVV